MLFMKCVLAVGIAALSGSVLAEGVAADANQSAASHILDVSPGGLSPQAAADKIRAARTAGDRARWAVRVKKGTYRIEKPLEMDAALSDVAWVGEDGACFSAGLPVTGWKDTGRGWWEAPIPRKADGQPAYFEMLWVNGRRADRARYPNGRECLPVKGSRQVPVTNSVTRMFAETVCFSNGVLKALGNIPKEELGSAQMCAAVNWMFGRRILTGLDVEKDEASAFSKDDWGGWKNWVTANALVWFENIRSAFDAPGEWFYDTVDGKVLYRPLPGESLTSISAVAPSEVTQLIAVRGKPDSGAVVTNVIFRNLTFEHTTGRGFFGEVGRPTQWHQYQAAVQTDAALVFTGARDCRIRNCTVRHTGNYGMRFYDGCQRDSVVDCTLEDLGAGGIMMGSEVPHVAKGEKLTRRIIRTLAPRSVAFNVVSNCTIRHIGLFVPEGTGVALTHASDCKVIHCDIYDGYYSGVSVGWSWGFGGSVAQRNEIAYNRISDLGHGVMSDMGGVYTLGTSFGTHVHDNVIHDIYSRFYGAWALYADEGSEGIVFERNLCWNTTDGGFVMHYGVDSIVRNNIFAWVRKIGLVRMSRDIVNDIPCSLHFYRNIILSDGTELVAKNVCKVGGIWSANVWWDVSGKPVFDTKDWEGWVASGKEINGVYADPKFEDARKLDFRLKADSPAFSVGFKSWDYSCAGRVTDK